MPQSINSIPVFPSVSVPVLSKLLDLSVSRVQQLVRQGIIDKTDRGKYDIIACVQQYIRYLHANQEGEINDPAKMLPKERLDWFRSEYEMRKLQREDRQLIPAAEYEADLAAALKGVAAALDSLPDVLERDAGLTGKSIDRARLAVDGMREDIYQKLKDLE